MSKRETPTKNLIQNVVALKLAFGISSNRQLAKLSGVFDRMIGKILNGESSPTIEVAEKLGHAFGITGWQLIIPNLPADLAKSGKLDTLINNYAKSSEKGRAYLESVAEREATYSANND